MSHSLIIESALLIQDPGSSGEELERNVLSSKGLQVMVAQDGLSGLELAIQINPDIVLVEQFPKGISGLEFISLLQKTTCKSSVVYISAPGCEKSIVSAFRLGVSDCLIKPFDANELDQAVTTILGKRRLEIDRENNFKAQITADAVQATTTTLSHYLNNSLMSIKGGLTLIEESLQQNQIPNGPLELIHQCRQSASLIQAVIRALLSSERLGLTAYSTTSTLINLDLVIRDELKSDPELSWGVKR